MPDSEAAGTLTEDTGPLLLPPPAPRGRVWFWVRVAVGVLTLACIAPGWMAWKAVEPRFAAITYLRMFGNVNWELERPSWRTVGTTDVDLSPYGRSMVRFSNGVWGGVIRSSADATDADLARLADLPPVQTLVLTGAAGIKGTGLEVLSRLPELRELRMNRATRGSPFYGPIVRDDTLRRIASGPRLRILEMNGARITDDGLAAIGPLTGLEELDLSWTKIGDAGLAHLKDLTRLEKLDLTSTRVTDSGLADLRGLTGLRVLTLHRTKVTPAGIKALRAALPALEQIDYGGMLGHEYDREDTAP